MEFLNCNYYKAYNYIITARCSLIDIISKKGDLAQGIAS